MKSTVETLSPTRVRFAIEVPFAELEPSLRKAYREIGASVNIPGFRKGKVPPAIIDQRVGRGAILTEAVQEAIPEHILAAVREHEVRMMGRPEVEITELTDGQHLRFTADIDVRPEITLPDVSAIEITVDEVTVADEDVQTQLDGLRQRFATLKTVERAARRGDFVQIDLAATVDGAEVPGGSATNLSHEVGSNQLLPGLDEKLEGMSADESATFHSTLVGGDFAGQEAEISVTVRTVKEREMPAVDDDFAQMASEFDSLDELKADLSLRILKAKRMQQLVGARDQALAELIARADVPAPEGVVKDEVNSRKQAMADQLERIGASLEDYLASEEKSEDDLDAELTTAAEEGVKIQLLLDAYADTESIQVTDDEFGHEVVHRASRAGVAPEQYYNQLVRSGVAASVFGDVRRGKALAAMLEKITIKDAGGAAVSLADLRGSDDDGHDHDHEDHTGHDHD